MPTRAIPILPGYEVISRIGRGAGAIISLARDGERGRLVAVKHILRRGPEDDRFIAQAETEWAVARDLDHPYLRKCFDLVRVRKWLKTRELVLVLEYVDGERLEDECPQDLPSILSIFMKVAEGLQALHQRGYAHADIKPNNILLTRDGGLKIIDFGQRLPARARQRACTRHAGLHCPGASQPHCHRPADGCLQFGCDDVPGRDGKVVPDADYGGTPDGDADRPGVTTRQRAAARAEPADSAAALAADPGVLRGGP